MHCFKRFMQMQLRTVLHLNLQETIGAACLSQVIYCNLRNYRAFVTCTLCDVKEQHTPTLGRCRLRGRHCVRRTKKAICVETCEMALFLLVCHDAMVESQVAQFESMHTLYIFSVYVTKKLTSYVMAQNLLILTEQCGVREKSQQPFDRLSW